MSDLLVPLVVLGAVAFLAMRVWRSVRAARADAACGDGCGCSSSSTKHSH